MKRALVLSLLVCGAIGLTACGKSDKEKASEYYQNEFGMDKEEADEFAEMFTEDGDEAEEKEEKAVTIELVKPSQEIVNSRIGDSITQVGNSVIYTDGSMTVDECIAKLEKDNGFELNFDESIDNPESMVSGARFSSVSVYDNEGNKICNVTGYNDTSDDKRLGDCMLLDVTPCTANSMYSLNCFSAGNICQGSYANAEYIKSSEQYAERIKEYPALKYDEIAPFFASQGYELTDDEIWDERNSGDADKCFCKSAIYSDKPVFTDANGNSFYKKTELKIYASSSIGEALSYKTNISLENAAMIHFELTDLSKLDDDTKNTILESVVDTYLNDYWNTSAYFDESAEVVGYYKTETNGLGRGTGFSFILKTDQGRYVETVAWVDQGVDGEIVVNSYEFYYGTSMYEVESLDEFLEKIGVSADSIMIL